MIITIRFVAEDEEDIRTVYYNALVDMGHKVILTSDGEECLNVYRRTLQEQQQQLHHDYDKVSSSPFDVVILDYKMSKKDDCRQLKKFLT